MGEAGAVAWYCFRATWRRRWSGYLGLVLIIGLIGGLSMASIAGARRTQASFSVYVATTNPSDVAVLTGLYQPAPTGYDAALISKIARLPFVRRVESEGGYESAEVNSQGYLKQSAIDSGASQVGLYSSIGGLFWNMDRLTVLQGRLPKLSSPNQVVLTPDAAQLLHLHVGSRFDLGVVGDKQSTEPCTKCRPLMHRVVKVVGLVTNSGALVQDDTDRSPTIYATTAFTRPLLKCCVDPTISFIQLTGGETHVAAVETDIARLLPAHFPRRFSPTISASEATAQRVIGPNVVALYLFGFVVALVALLVAGQFIGRQLNVGATDVQAVRALGATRLAMVFDVLLGVVGAVVLGSMAAVGVALALSPLMPIGPVGPVYPDKGVSFDGLVLGAGFLVLAGSLTLLAIAFANLQAPSRSGRRRVPSSARPSVLVRSATRLGLSAPAVSGVHFAVVPDRGQQAAPVRSAVFGAVVAIAVVVASLTVGASIDHLSSRPALYGWNWTVALSAAGGVGVMPVAALKSELGRDHDVVAWSGTYFSQLNVDGREVPVLGMKPGARVAPPLLSGHGLRRSNEVVLGVSTLRSLHTHIGGFVKVASGSSQVTRLRVVGTATFPAYGGQPHTEMGIGALLDYRLIPASSRNIFNLPGAGPNVAFVRLRSPTAGKDLKGIHVVANALSHRIQDDVNVVTVQRPAEIADAGTLRATPTFLAAALAASSVLALALTLTASVRRRRQDLALLKVLGFRRRQIAATLVWQSSVAAVIGIVLGVPLGVLGGRELWTLFARSIDAVPQPVVPVLTVTLVALGALLFSVVVAWLPGRSAARTSPALVLRSE